MAIWENLLDYQQVHKFKVIKWLSVFLPSSKLIGSLRQQFSGFGDSINSVLVEFLQVFAFFFFFFLFLLLLTESRCDGAWKDGAGFGVPCISSLHTLRTEPFLWLKNWDSKRTCSSKLLYRLFSQSSLSYSLSWFSVETVVSGLNSFPFNPFRGQVDHVLFDGLIIEELLVTECLEWYGPLNPIIIHSSSTKPKSIARSNFIFFMRPQKRIF